MLGAKLIDRMIEIWLTTEFEGGRHERRVRKIAALDSGDAADTPLEVPLYPSSRSRPPR